METKGFGIFGGVASNVRAEGLPADAPRLKRVLTVKDLIFYGIILIQPIAPLPIFGESSDMSKGHVSTTILIAMVAMMNFRPRGLVSSRTPTLFLNRQQSFAADLVREGRG